MPADNNAMFNAIESQKWAEVKRLCVSDPSMCQSKYNDGSLDIHYGELAIHLACRRGAPLEIIKQICNAYEHGIKIADDDGDLPIHYACWYNMSLESIQYIHRLHQEGIKAKCKYGNIPLHDACRYASVDIIEYLHRVYPDGVAVKNNNGETPLDYLKSSGRSRNDKDAILAILNSTPSPLSTQVERPANISDEPHAKKARHGDNQRLTENPNEADADCTTLDAARKYVTVMDNWHAAKKVRENAKINRQTQEKAEEETKKAFNKARATFKKARETFKKTTETLLTSKLKEAAAIADLDKAKDEKQEAHHLLHQNGTSNDIRGCGAGTLDKMKQCFLCCNDYNEGRSEIDSSDCRPVTLPCCGKTICMDCVNNYRASKVAELKGRRKKVPCLLCKKPFHPEQDIFVPNKDHSDFICDLRKNTQT